MFKRWFTTSAKLYQTRVVLLNEKQHETTMNLNIEVKETIDSGSRLRIKTL